MTSTTRIKTVTRISVFDDPHNTFSAIGDKDSEQDEYNFGDSFVNTSYKMRAASQLS
jgi:hypothetical protein